MRMVACAARPDTGIDSQVGGCNGGAAFACSNAAPTSACSIMAGDELLSCVGESADAMVSSPLRSLGVRCRSSAGVVTDEIACEGGRLELSIRASRGAGEAGLPFRLPGV